MTKNGPDAASEVAEQALLVAGRAIDEVAAWMKAAGPLSDDVIDGATELLIGSSNGDEHRVESSRRMLAFQLLFEAGFMTREDDPHDSEDEHTDPFDGYRLLNTGDLKGALEVATAVLRDADATDTTHWNHGNLVHHGHILRGRLFLLDGDIPAAAAELLASAATEGSPQLNSFGPDLWLAWQLLRVGEHEAAMSYFQRVAAFWTPHDSKR